jgi:hypothetical protein
VRTHPVNGIYPCSILSYRKSIITTNIRTGSAEKGRDIGLLQVSCNAGIPSCCMFRRTYPLDNDPASSLPYKAGRGARPESTNCHVTSRAAAMLSVVFLKDANLQFSRETAVPGLHEEAQDPASGSDDVKEHSAPARRR